MHRILHRSTASAARALIQARRASTQLEFTKDRYNVDRGKFNRLEAAHYQFFEDLLGMERVIRDPDECEVYNVDWVKNVRGMSRCILKPKTTEEVSQILAFCNAHTLAVCPQGGNTGLVGGSVPVFDEIVLTTALMNEIIAVDDISGAVVCQAGCILENLDNHLADYDLMVPLDLGAKASCHIGGNVSTNAGGLRLLRYGNLHGSVLGLEAVKANGEVIDCLGTLRKDNTGYHLKHLFIGSEGTLGVVTRVAIQYPQRPRAANIAFLGTDSFSNVLKTFRASKQHLSEVLSSFELIDAQSLNLVTKYFNKTNPISAHPFYVLIETHGSCASHDEEKLHNFLKESMSSGLVSDGTVSTEPSKIRDIWAFRELITPALQHDGYVFKYDFSIPLKTFYSIVEIMRERLGEKAVTVCGYGHVGDSNLHLNITLKEYCEEMAEKIEPFVYQYTSQMRGSVSAEHGIGFRKSKYLQYSKSHSAISLMRTLKDMMDPKGILNPYKVLPQYNNWNV